MLLALLGALMIGITLGLLGSGGSILTVPVLVYLVGEPEKLAIGESLGIVALISLAGMLPFAFRRMIHWRSVLYFGVPGMVGTYAGAWMSQFVSGTLQLVLFAVVMLIAAVMMFRQKIRPLITGNRQAAWKIAVEGLGVGVITGLVGVGGGFLIVPALVILGNLPMHLAVGTSLAIIALKSVTGFYKYTQVLAQIGLSINWELVFLFGAIGFVGSLAGERFGRNISQERLTKGFAAFLVAMGLFILVQNFMVLINEN